MNLSFYDLRWFNLEFDIVQSNIGCKLGAVQNLLYNGARAKCREGKNTFSTNISRVITFFLGVIGRGQHFSVFLQSKSSGAYTFCTACLSIENQQIDSIRHFAQYIFE